MTAGGTRHSSYSVLASVYVRLANISPGIIVVRKPGILTFQSSNLAQLATTLSAGALSICREPTARLGVEGGIDDARHVY